MCAIPRRRVLIYRGITKDMFRLLIGGELIHGRYIREFEKKFADYIGIGNAVTVSSGTAALSLILESLPLNRGDEVILPAYTFTSVPACVKALGLSPHFVDIDPNTDNLDITELKKAINQRTKVIIATHIFGRPCEIEEVVAIAKENNLFVIEDCAHALGSEHRGKKLGTFGDAAFYSFSLTKPFNTFNGGVVVSNDRKLSDKIRGEVSKLQNFPKTPIVKNILIGFLLHFFTKPFVFTLSIYPILLLLSFVNKDIIKLYDKIFKKHIFYGFKKYKFSNFQAFIGLKTMQNYDKIIIERYNSITKFVDLCRKEKINIFERNNKINKDIFYYFFIIKHPKKDIIAKDLLLLGIDTGKHIMRNCGKIFDESNAYPNTEKAYNNSLQLPIANFNDKNMLAVIRVLKRHI